MEQLVDDDGQGEHECAVAVNTCRQAPAPQLVCTARTSAKCATEAGHSFMSASGLLLSAEQVMWTSVSSSEKATIAVCATCCHSLRGPSHAVVQMLAGNWPGP